MKERASLEWDLLAVCEFHLLEHRWADPSEQVISSCSFIITQCFFCSKSV
jgi:hypothetical protein